MKIMICFPPLASDKGFPTLGQNRQFQYFKEPTYIYPMVPASAATLLSNNGFEVCWLDCIAQGISYDDFLARVRVEEPDVIAIETKTPAMGRIWHIADDIQECAHIRGFTAHVVLFGDHVTALPEESMRHCAVDFVLTGGDYDFLLLNLCKALSGGSCSVPFAERLEPGIWYKEDSMIKNTGKFKLDHNLNCLPMIDRKLTQWRAYAYQNGNYRSTPGTYMMSGRDCWWGKCTFCSWPQLYPRFRACSVEKALAEVATLVDVYGVREIMDDSGSFPVGEWLGDFCRGMISRELHTRVTLDCNMRFGALSYDEYALMRRAGFRFLLFGIESANQATLDRIKKNVTVDTIITSCKNARKAGLYPHITLMFGYPWESYEDACKTKELGAWLLKKGYAYTMQATMVIPYPGTPLYQECAENNWLVTRDWSRYDMKRPVMRVPFEEEQLLSLIRSMYAVSFHPEFIMRKILSIRGIDDVTYFARVAGKVMGHIFDFKHG